MTSSAIPGLHELAAAAGLARQWRDVSGREQLVTDEALMAVLAALGLRSANPRQIRESMAELAEQQSRPAPLLITEVGLPTLVGTGAISAILTDETGGVQMIAVADGMLAPIAGPGYYGLELGGTLRRLAVAPRHCPLPAPQAQRRWGTSVQIPALRGPNPSAFGGFGELAAAAQALGEAGCAALAINPVHALFPGHGTDYSPYSPSSRTFLNTALGDPVLLGLPPLPGAPSGELIDWPRALPERLKQLRALFAGLSADQRAQIALANQAEGEALQRHALFDALDCHFRPRGAADWRAWPAALRDPASAATAQFARQHSEEIEFHCFAQWLARESLAVAQQRARAAGMSIGLIADLAVGVHPGGSDCWAMPGAMLHGLTIGAPPDPLGPLGQNWSITGFSPAGLRATGDQPWIAMLRSALRSAGGLRIDHAFGLARLWVIPDGGTSAQGAYLSYPLLDLIRLVTLEAHRAGALIIAEDLGTSPPGFTHLVTDRNMLGMRVLWFERADDDGFIGAADYPANCVAMTGTHDTPTLAGWWSGRDLDWAEQLERLPAGVDRAEAESIREWDRGLLWSTLTGRSDRPAPGDTAPLVDAALAHIARTPALLAMAPLEDLLGEIEQPNIPGTVHEHPNWQRRMDQPIAEALRQPDVARRINEFG